MPGRPISLGNLLGNVIADLGIARKLDEARIVDAWPVIAGDAIGRATTSVWVKGSTLYVKLGSAAWRHELHLQREAWRDRLNRHLGKDLVREIRFC